MLTSLAISLAAVAASATTEGESMLPTTSPPIVYVINYSGDYFRKPEYIDQFRDSPPDLLHVGKATPINHHWGPVCMYQGENQWTGGPGHTLNWDNIALISPEALEQRIATIRKTLERYHAIGVQEIVPYISYHTLAGDHQKRLGFWRFYDRWDAYARWAGARPQHDPFDWLVVDGKGDFVGGSCGGYSPDYYAPLHRYRACINHPDWSDWQRRLVRMVAEVGYDGCFVDNCHPDPCYCRYCKAAFRDFLKTSQGLFWVQRLTEGLDVDKLQLDSPDVPAELVRRARLMRTRDHLGMLRQVGREVNPNFTIFPNGNSTAECLVTGGQCDRLMFESTYSPGILANRETATIDRVAIEVSDQNVRPNMFTHRYEVGDRTKWMEMEAEIVIPMEVQLGEPVPLEVKVLTVGQSQTDNDFAEDFYLLLREETSGRDIRLDLEPRLVLGAAGPSADGQRPPAVLRAKWIPKQPGRYIPHLGFTYTDSGHIQSQRHLARLDRGGVCRTHIGTLMFAQHMKARSIFLGYETRRLGWENVAELGLAEMAAFSGGGGFASNGPVQAKYRVFFKAHSELYDGWQPTAPAAVLYAYWGSNPLAHVRPVEQPTIHDYLGGTGRLFVPLVDSTLPEEAEKLRPFQIVYLQAREYDMTAGQLEALKNYVRMGGWIALLDEGLTINGRSASELLGVGDDRTLREYGRGKISLWNWADPVTPTAPVLSAEGIAKNLRCALYQRDNKLALHAVNYNVCLLDPAKAVLDLKDIKLRVPVPGTWTKVVATSFDPDGKPRSLDCIVEDGMARFTLSNMHIYKIVLLESR